MKEFVLTCRGGSAKGDTLSMGEWTEVAFAKRGVRGCLSEESEDELDDLVRTNGAGRLFSGLVGDILIGKTEDVCMYIKIIEGTVAGPLREEQSGTLSTRAEEALGSAREEERGEVLQIETSYREKSSRRGRRAVGARPAF
jgi:hypothetical protein